MLAAFTQIYTENQEQMEHPSDFKCFKFHQKGSSCKVEACKVLDKESLVAKKINIIKKPNTLH